jgi:peptidoglycan/xylan/chitin deacetylase (PgdA/CDA1 family)
MSRAEVKVRFILVWIRSKVDDRLFYILTSLLKKIRARLRNSRSSANMLSNDHESSNSYAELLVCITHDIDSKSCALNLEDLLKVSEVYRIPTTVNVLTQGPYDLNELLSRIPEHHEIGLHGDTHDIAFGFRSELEIDKRITLCLESLFPRKILSFRAPGLAISKELLDCLDKHGIYIDSSIVASPLFKGGVQPVLHSLLSGRVVEVPLVVSDDFLFRDIALSEIELIKLITSVSSKVAESGGILVMNFHPGVTFRKIKEYEKVIFLLANRPNTKFMTISQAVQFKS